MHWLTQNAEIREELPQCPQHPTNSRTINSYDHWTAGRQYERKVPDPRKCISVWPEELMGFADCWWEVPKADAGVLTWQRTYRSAR